MNSHILQTSENTLTKIMLLKGILLIGILAALLFHPAEAQTLKQTGVSIFNALYAVIGVVGAICVLVTGINWAAGNFLGIHSVIEHACASWFSAGGQAPPSIPVAWHAG